MPKYRKDGIEDCRDVLQNPGRVFPRRAAGIRKPGRLCGRQGYGGRPERAGKDLTREGLIQGIESIHQMDLGLRPQWKLDYSSRDHAGLRAVISTVIRGGRAVPFTDWAMVK
jgi:hypothetical protein